MKKCVRGVIVSGSGQASTHKVGAFAYFPGSLNVFVGRRERDALLKNADIVIDSTRSVDKYRKATFYDEPVMVGFSRSGDTIELFSEKNLRATHGLKDGDRVKVYF